MKCCGHTGHWLLPSLLGTLRADLAEQLLTDCLRLYEDHSRDAGYVLSLCQSNCAPPSLSLE